VSADAPSATSVRMVLDGFAHDGAAVGRLPDGRACFVDYGIPGERVTVRITEQRRRWARGTVVEVLDPSPDRVTPPCPIFGPAKCGGCRTQHIAVPRQAELLGTVITEQLRRIGGLDPPDGAVEVITPHAPDGLGYRNRARFAVTDDGRLGFRRARSHDTVAVDDCPLLAPTARSALRGMAQGWHQVSEVRLQVGTAGDAAVAVTTTGRDARVPSPLPTTLLRRGRRARPDGRARVRHDVAGHTFVVSATSFFQASITAAEVLVDLVRELTPVAAGSHVVDCYAGVGLFSVALASDGARVTAIESDPGACADARINAADLPIDVRRADVAAPPALDAKVDAVVLDPPRTGAGPVVTDWISGLAPRRVTYVSCDPATFARDARALTDHGMRLERLVGVDQFTHTGRVELVAGFRRP
jgi:tRNA/tmRNA/rRNA uracil-C5-methylase (TrmA/RlmC/RlmD family)